MFQNKTTYSILIFLFMLLGSGPIFFKSADHNGKREPSSINRAVMALSAPTSVFYGKNRADISPDLITAYNQIKSEMKPFDFSKVAPNTVNDKSSAKNVISQIVDNSVSFIWNSDSVRSSTLGQMGRKVENSVKQEVDLGGAGGAQQKIKFNMAAFQGLAQVQYEGFTNAALNYKLLDSAIGLEVSEKVVGNKSLVLSHEVKPSDRLSQVSLQWSF